MIYLIVTLVAGALGFVIYDNYRKARETHDAFHKFTVGDDLPEPPPPASEINPAELVLFLKRSKK